MRNQNESDSIKIWRKILDWEWYSDTNTFVVFLHLLLKASPKDGRLYGYEIKKGQLVTTLNAISRETGLSIQNVRTALAHLKKTGEINTESDAKLTLVTICKYNIYQDEDIM